MKRTAFMTAALAYALLGSSQLAVAQAPSSDPKNDTKKEATPPQTTPSGKHLPQAKTQPEFDAYQAAMASTTPEATEKASDGFAAKFPDSEIKILIYKQAMRS